MVYLEAPIQGFFLKIVIRFRYTWEIPVGRSFSVKLQAVCMPFWWKWAPSWVFLKFFAYFIIYYFLMRKRLFLGELTLVDAS